MSGCSAHASCTPLEPQHRFMMVDNPNESMNSINKVSCGGIPRARRTSKTSTCEEGEDEERCHRYYPGTLSGRNEIIFRSLRISIITTSKRPQVHPAVEGRGLEVFTAEALGFIADLHRRFNPTRLDLLRRRGKRQARGGQRKNLRLSEGPTGIPGGVCGHCPLVAPLYNPR